MIVGIFLGHHRYECQSRGWHRQAELKVQSCIAHCHAFVRELVQRTSDLMIDFWFSRSSSSVASSWSPGLSNPSIFRLPHRPKVPGRRIEPDVVTVAHAG
jgi:hypothetical protein